MRPSTQRVKMSIPKYVIRVHASTAHGFTLMILDERIEKILISFPFLSYGTMLGRPYLGIIQNCDNQLLSMYVLDAIPTEEMRREFLRLGEAWWWGSNRQIPINIFLKDRFRPFREYLTHFSRKDFILEAGPTVSLHETIARRVRKRQITLVRRTPA